MIVWRSCGTKNPEVGDQLIHAAEGHYQVTVACNIERGDCDASAGKRGKQFPTPILVPVPIQAASKSRPRKLLYVKVDVCIGEPRRERHGINQVSKEGLPLE